MNKSCTSNLEIDSKYENKTGNRVQMNFSFEIIYQLHMRLGEEEKRRGKKKYPKMKRNGKGTKTRRDMIRKVNKRKENKKKKKKINECTQKMKQFVLR